MGKRDQKRDLNEFMLNCSDDFMFHLQFSCVCDR